MQQLLRKKVIMCIAVRRKVDFAAVTEEKLAIFIAIRTKVNFAADI